MTTNPFYIAHDTLPLHVALRRQLNVTDEELRWLVVIHPFVMTSGRRSQLGDLAIELHLVEDHSTWSIGPWVRITRHHMPPGGTGNILREMAVPLIGLASLDFDQPPAPVHQWEGDSLPPLSKGERDALRAKLAGTTPGPWRLRGDAIVDRDDRVITRAPTLRESAPGQRNDALYIESVAPEYIRRLLDQLDALTDDSRSHEDCPTCDTNLTARCPTCDKNLAARSVKS